MTPILITKQYTFERYAILKIRTTFWSFDGQNQACKFREKSIRKSAIIIIYRTFDIFTRWEFKCGKNAKRV